MSTDVPHPSPPFTFTLTPSSFIAPQYRHELRSVFVREQLTPEALMSRLQVAGRREGGSEAWRVASKQLTDPSTLTLRCVLFCAAACLPQAQRTAPPLLLHRSLRDITPAVSEDASLSGIYLISKPKNSYLPRALWDCI